MRSRKSLRGWLLPVLVAAAVWPAVGVAQSDAIDPEAVNLLRRSTDFVAGLKQFRFEATAALEIVTVEGQKLQFDHHVAITVQRPNKIRSERVGELVRQTIIYDGKTLSLNLPDYGYYATVAAPATIDAALDFARDKLDVVAPGADFLYTNAFGRLSEGLTSAAFIGEAVVAGVRCDHLAFRNAEVDWQICIEQGAKPLPRKIVITSKKMPQAPEFITVIGKWDLAPRVTDATFSFTPSKGATKIDWLPASAAKR